MAKIFKSGNSQAIRIPKEFRINADEVIISGDGNRLIITPKPNRESWENAVGGIYGCCPSFDTGRNSMEAI
ncbi:MAG: AbrB/MazE/SpoVT family DNA-binding domain-containing protein [Treponema sp.]|nr:AbrB/MazE/SpoVT family DNA-binding domain-containing protein [Treponema sp.]